MLWVKVMCPETRRRMKNNTIPQRPELAESEIQHAAYYLWIESGRTEGCDLEHWLAAKSMLCHRQGRDARTGGKVPEIAAPAAPRRPGNF